MPSLLQTRDSSRSESSLAFGDAAAADGARVTEETGRAGATSDKVIARLEHVGNRIRQADDTRPAACPLWGRLLSSRGFCLRCLRALICVLVCKTDCDGELQLFVLLRVAKESVVDAVGHGMLNGAGAAHLGLGVGGPARVAVHANAMPVLHKEDGAALVRIHEATTCVKPSDTTGHFWRSCFGERNLP